MLLRMSAREEAATEPAEGACLWGCAVRLSGGGGAPGLGREVRTCWSSCCRTPSISDDMRSNNTLRKDEEG